MSKPYRLASQHGPMYQIHVFRSEAHARAHIAVNRLKNFKRPSDAHGSCLPRPIDHTGEHDQRVEAMILTIECGESDATPATPDGRRLDCAIDRTYAVSVPVQNGAKENQRTYTVGHVVKVIRAGQRIGLLNQYSVIPATVIRLGYNSVIVAPDNGRSRPREIVIDCTTTGTINSLSAIVSAPEIQ